MSADQSTVVFARRNRRDVMAVLFGLGLLGIPAYPGYPHRVDDGATVRVSQDGPEVKPESSWTQLPIESRELWKFRLTRGR